MKGLLAIIAALLLVIAISTLSANGAFDPEPLVITPYGTLTQSDYIKCNFGNPSPNSANLECVKAHAR